MPTVGMLPAHLRNQSGNGRHIPAPAHGSAEPSAQHICLLGYANTPCCLRTIDAFPGWQPPRSPASHRPLEPRAAGEAGGGGGENGAVALFHICTK